MYLLKNKFNSVLILSLGIALTAVFACKDESSTSEVKTVEVKFKKEGELMIKKANSDSLLATLDIEIADDDYQTETGLMYRSSMARNRGMLFIFPDTDYRAFYMKNTEFPLDIIYLNDQKKIVSIQANAKPGDETSLPSEAPAKYVLEVNAGLSNQWGLEQGDLIEFSQN